MLTRLGLASGCRTALVEGALLAGLLAVAPLRWRERRVRAIAPLRWRERCVQAVAPARWRERRRPGSDPSAAVAPFRWRERAYGLSHRFRWRERRVRAIAPLRWREQCVQVCLLDFLLACWLACLLCLRACFACLLTGCTAVAAAALPLLLHPFTGWGGWLLQSPLSLSGRERCFVPAPLRCARGLAVGGQCRPLRLSRRRN
jgi:hypothetical protein